MYETLFNPAFWMPLALGLVGVAVFIYGNARVESKVRNAGAAILLLTLVWTGVAYFINTFTEKCVIRTNSIVAAVEESRWDDVSSLLDRNTRLAGLRGPDIAHTAERYASMGGLQSIYIAKREVSSTITGVDVTIDTYTEGRQSGLSTWTFSYEQRSDGILLSEIRPVRLFGRPLEEVERMIGRLSK